MFQLLLEEFYFDMGISHRAQAASNPLGVGFVCFHAKLPESRPSSPEMSCFLDQVTARRYFIRNCARSRRRVCRGHRYCQHNRPCFGSVKGERPLTTPRWSGSSLVCVLYAVMASVKVSPQNSVRGRYVQSSRPLYPRSSLTLAIFPYSHPVPSPTVHLP